MSKKSEFMNAPAVHTFMTTAGNAAHNDNDTQNASNASDAYNAHEVFSGDPVSKRTQGRKGQKLPRMNTAYSPENYEYIQIMARIKGCSATEYVNRVLAADREANRDKIAQFLEWSKEVSE